MNIIVEIVDIKIFSSNPKKYVNEYVAYLKKETGATSITGSLITLTELGDLGCTYPSDYKYVSTLSSRTCENSPYARWLNNGQYWWTKSAESQYNMYVWIMFANGNLTANDFDFEILS